MGADIRTEGHHAVVRGVPRLSGAPVRASDIRAGAALVVAGLAAEGETIVAGADHIDRGYEDLPGRLRSWAPRCTGPTKRLAAAEAGSEHRPAGGAPVAGRRGAGGGRPRWDRAATARLISLVERGGEARPRGGPAHLPGRRRRLHRRYHRRPGRRQVDPDRPADHRAPPGRGRDRGAGRRPVVALQRRGAARRPGADAGPRPRRRVFIRSMATRGHLGGLALATPEAVRVLDAAGFDRSSSRPSAWARSRSRSPGPRTPPWSSSTRAGA